VPGRGCLPGSWFRPPFLFRRFPGLGVTRDETCRRVSRHSCFFRCCRIILKLLAGSAPMPEPAFPKDFLAYFPEIFLSGILGAFDKLFTHTAPFRLQL